MEEEEGEKKRKGFSDEKDVRGKSERWERERERVAELEMECNVM